MDWSSDRLMDTIDTVDSWGLHKDSHGQLGTAQGHTEKKGLP